MKWMALDAIHDDLVRTLGKDVVAYSTVTKYVRSAQFSGREEATPPEAPDVERSPVDEAMLTALTKFPFPFPFSSVCELSRMICLPRSTVHPHPHRSRNRHLTQSLRLTSRCDILMGPPLVMAEQKQILVQMAIELLQILSVQSKVRASGTTLSLWASRGLIYSVSIM
jgi:hypothetical protein